MTLIVVFVSADTQVCCSAKHPIAANVGPEVGAWGAGCRCCDGSSAAFPGSSCGCCTVPLVANCDRGSIDVGYGHRRVTSPESAIKRDLGVKDLGLSCRGAAA